MKWCKKTAQAIKYRTHSLAIWYLILSKLWSSLQGSCRFFRRKWLRNFYKIVKNQPYNPSASHSFGTSLYTREAENAVVRNLQGTAKGCCERYGANDDVVGRWLAAAVEISDILLFLVNIKLKNRLKFRLPLTRELSFFEENDWGRDTENLLFIAFSPSVTPTACHLPHQMEAEYEDWFLYHIVVANCVRPFLIWYELTGDRRSPLRVVRWL